MGKGGGEGDETLFDERSLCRARSLCLRVASVVGFFVDRENEGELFQSHDSSSSRIIFSFSLPPPLAFPSRESHTRGFFQEWKTVVGRSWNINDLVELLFVLGG